MNLCYGKRWIGRGVIYALLRRSSDFSFFNLLLLWGIYAVGESGEVADSDALTVHDGLCCCRSKNTCSLKDEVASAQPVQEVVLNGKPLTHVRYVRTYVKDHCGTTSR